MKNDTFFIDLKRGAQAEVLVMNYFRMNGYDVIDVTKNPAYFKKDIDLLVFGHDGTRYYFEIKAD